VHVQETNRVRFLDDRHDDPFEYDVVEHNGELVVKGTYQVNMSGSVKQLPVCVPQKTATHLKSLIVFSSVARDQPLPANSVGTVCWVFSIAQWTTE